MRPEASAARNRPGGGRLVEVLERAAVLAERGAMAPTPTGPPPNFSMIVDRMRRSSSSNPYSSTSSRASASRAWEVDGVLPPTSAKSRRAGGGDSRCGACAAAGADLPRGSGSMRIRGSVRSVRRSSPARDVVEVEPQGDAKRPWSGWDRRPGRVVAPTSVKGSRSPSSCAPSVPRRSSRRGGSLPSPIENLLDGRVEAVDLVTKSTSFGCKFVRIPRGPRARDHRARGHPQAGGHLPRDDVGERRLARPGGPVRRTWSSGSRRPRAAARKTDRFSRTCLPDVLAEGLRPQLGLDRRVFFERGRARTSRRPSSRRVYCFPSLNRGQPLSASFKKSPKSGGAPYGRSRRRRAPPRPSGTRG